LADALEDALLIADSRGARLNGERMAVEGGTGSALFTRQEPHHALAHHHFETRRLGALSLPGHDLTSASTARRYVHETAHSWGLSPATADDLETIVGELVANALEHSDSHTITVTCSLTPDTAAVSVTDQGRGRTRVPFAESSRPKELEQESGRGLLITDALATQWGTRQTSSGLTVWAEVALDSPEPAE
jgi:anti-sigma regulatory factor (Ser/Thr protein kinase)